MGVPVAVLLTGAAGSKELQSGIRLQRPGETEGRESQDGKTVQRPQSSTTGVGQQRVEQGNPSKWKEHVNVR